MTQFLVLLTLEVSGLVLIWFLLRARLRRALEIEGLLGEARREIRGLAMELNETADRNITLIEDRLEALHELLEEADRRFGVFRREIDTRAAEREVYTRLGRPRVPAVPSRAAPEPLRGEAGLGPGREEAARLSAPPAAIPAALAAAFAEAPAPAPREESLGGQPPEPRAPAEQKALAGEAPVRLELGRRIPELRRAEESVIPPRPLREEALDLYRKGFSADIIAVRLGATVAEIELLVSLEEGRRRAGMESPTGESSPADEGP